MAEPRSDEVARRDAETTHPRNPPNSVLNKDARRAAVMSYFVPVVVLFLVIAGALVYWSTRSPEPPKEGQRTEIGTIGRTDGGFDPKPAPNSTNDEIRFRGSDLAPITSVSDLASVEAREMAGRRVEIGDARVDSASGNLLWLRDGDRKFAVVTPAGAPSVTAGSTISVHGRVEPDDSGAPRIIADRIQAK